MIHSHYDSLKVARNASVQAIRAAYKSLASVYYPDKGNVPGAEANRVMKMLNEAYAVLKDPVRRQHYDDWLSGQLSKQTSRQQSGPYGNAGATTANSATSRSNSGDPKGAKHLSLWWLLMAGMLAIWALAILAPKLSSYARSPLSTVSSVSTTKDSTGSPASVDLRASPIAKEGQVATISVPLATIKTAAVADSLAASGNPSPQAPVFLVYNPVQTPSPSGK